MAHTHHHSHEPASYGRAFVIGITLNMAFVLCELVLGVRSGSLALIADAGHNFSDVLALVLAWGATLLARRPASGRFTYGMRRSSILVALVNALLLYATLGGITWEALGRFREPAAVDGGVVVVVAAIGIAINSLTAWLFASGRHADVNVRAAFLHLVADAAISFGVVVAGALVIWTGWAWLDPFVSLVLVGVIALGSWGLLEEAVRLALDAAPEQVDVPRVRGYLSALPAVLDVHDLHIWALSTREVALTAHLVARPDVDPQRLLVQASTELHDSYGIEHATLQIETSEGARGCAQARCCDDAR